MKQFRSYGWDPKDLKLYWNVQQLEDLCPKDEFKAENEQTDPINILPCDPSDVDAMAALRRHPISQRNHTCKIEYVNEGIEKAVFDVPENAQLIVLNFAVSDTFSSHVIDDLQLNILERTVTWRGIFIACP